MKLHLGSSGYVSGNGGRILQHMEYLPFGEAMMDEHINSRNSPFKYNGKHLDEETGNYYYGARYYDPKLSNFISVDPLAEKYPDWSPYRYGFNNPIKYIDPTGMLEGDSSNGDGIGDWLKKAANWVSNKLGITSNPEYKKIEDGDMLEQSIYLKYSWINVYHVTSLIRVKVCLAIIQWTLTWASLIV